MTNSNEEKPIETRSIKKNLQGNRNLPVREASKKVADYKETLRPKKQDDALTSIAAKKPAAKKQATKTKAATKTTAKKSDSAVKKRSVKNSKEPANKKKQKLQEAAIARKDETKERRAAKKEAKEAKKQAKKDKKLMSRSPLLKNFNIHHVLNTANGKHIADWLVTEANLPSELKTAIQIQMVAMNYATAKWREIAMKVFLFKHPDIDFIKEMESPTKWLTAPKAPIEAPVETPKAPFEAPKAPIEAPIVTEAANLVKLTEKKAREEMTDTTESEEDDSEEKREEKGSDDEPAALVEDV